MPERKNHMLFSLATIGIFAIICIAYSWIDEGKKGALNRVFALLIKTPAAVIMAFFIGMTFDLPWWLVIIAEAAAFIICFFILPALLKWIWEMICGFIKWLWGLICTLVKWLWNLVPSVAKIIIIAGIIIAGIIIVVVILN